MGTWHGTDGESTDKQNVEITSDTQLTEKALINKTLNNVRHTTDGESTDKQNVNNVRHTTDGESTDKQNVE